MRAALTALTVAVAIGAGVPAAAQQGTHGEFDRLVGDGAHWRRFLIPTGEARRSRARIIEGAEGPPWLVRAGQLAWYDGYRWVPVPGAAEALTGHPKAALLPGGDLLIAARGSLFQASRRGLTPVDVSWNGRRLAVSEAVTTPSGRVFLQVNDRGQVRILERTEAGLTELVPPAPLERSGNAAIMSSASGAIFLSTHRGLLVDRGSGWQTLLGTSGQELLDASHLHETPDGAGVMYVHNPYAQRGIWTWVPGGAPRLWTAGRFDFPRALGITPAGDVLLVTDGLETYVLADDEARRIEVVPEALAGARFLTFGNEDRLWTTDDVYIYLARPDPRGPWREWRPAGVLGHRRVHDILPLDDGSLWLATSDGLLVRGADGSARATSEIDGSHLGSVTGLATDPAGNVWIVSGSGFAGAYRYDGVTWRHFGAADGLADAYFHAVRTDDSGRLWFLGLRDQPYRTEAPRPGGVYVLGPNGFEHWSARTNMPAGPVYDTVADGQGNRWFVGRAGVLRHDGRTWRVASHRQDSVGRPFALAAGADGTVYVGDRDHGLGTIDDDGTLVFAQASDGYGLDGVWSVRTAVDGAVWAGGRGGVMRLVEGVASVFGAGSGLGNPDIWPVLPHGDEVLVGTQGHGLLILERPNPPPPRLTLTAEALNGGRLLLRWTAATWWASTPADRIEVRYRVDDGDWSPWLRDSVAEVSRVAYGRHRVEAQARGDRGELAVRGARLQVAVPAPLARTPAALGGLLLLAMLLAGGTIRYSQQRLDQARRLRASEARYRSIFEGSADFIFTHDLDGKLLAVNRAALDAIGYTADEARGLPVDTILHTDPSDGYEHATHDSRGRSVPYEAHLVRRDGTPIPVEVHTQALVEDGIVVGVQGIARDIRSRRRAEETLRNIAMGTSAETGAGFFRSVTECLARELRMDHALIAVLEPPLPPRTAVNRGRVEARTIALWSDGRFMDDVAYDLAGTPCERVSTSSICVFPDGVQQRFPTDVMLVDLGARSYAGMPLRGSDGTTLGLMAVLAREPLQDPQLASTMLKIFANRATAELERLRAERALLDKESRLRQSQKMEALGRMAGGVAHDFNNLLTVVNGHTQLVLETGTLSELQRADLEQVIAAGHSAARLIEQLLTFSRGDHERASCCELDTVVRRIQEVLRGILGDRRRLELDLDAAGTLIPIGTAELEQVVLNLVVNAADATDDDGGARIVTRADRRKGNVLLRVIDDGCGMDEATQAAALEPFFTTKDTGAGIGLGLSTVYGITQRAGADLRIDSRPGEGTTIEIVWPPGEEVSSERLSDLDEAAVGAADASNIMVVEDQEMVRSLARRALEARGYSVTEASSAEEALAQLHDGSPPFHLVISDVVMPGCSGVELAARVREFCPQTRILLMSGYNDVVTGGPGGDHDGFIAKPFSPTTWCARSATPSRRPRHVEAARKGTEFPRAAAPGGIMPGLAGSWHAEGGLQDVMQRRWLLRACVSELRASLGYAIGALGGSILASGIVLAGEPVHRAGGGAVNGVPLPVAATAASWPWLRSMLVVAVAALALSLLALGAHALRMQARQQRQRRREAERYRRIFESSSDVIFTVDTHERLTSINRAGLRSLGYQEHEVLGRWIGDFLAPESRDLARQMRREKLRGRNSTRYEVTLLRADGERILAEFSTQLMIEQHRVVGIHGIARDVGERRRAEETLRNIAIGISGDTGKDLFRSLVESLARELGVEYAFVAALEDGPDGGPGRARTLALWARDRIVENVEYDLAGTPCQNVQRAGLRIYPDRLQERFPDDPLTRTRGAESYAGTPLRAAVSEPLGLIAIAHTGPLTNPHLTRSMLQIFAVRAAAEMEKLRAESALRDKEKELQQALKMEALGRMAGGIAHDFNNLLTVVNGFAELALTARPPGDPERDDLLQILGAGRSAARLTEQLLTFSRRETLASTRCDLNVAIRGMRDLLRGLLRDHHRLLISLEESPLEIPTGLAQIEQVLMNLAVNAADAMPDGGTLSVRTLALRGRNEASLEVSDDGVGMDEATRSLALEPFFTTKEQGAGTGLGLSTVYGIVQQAGGTLELASGPGQGTRVRIRWPLTRPAPLAEPDEAEPVPLETSGQETILVVEDQKMVRRLARRALEARGYHVLSAASAAQALEHLGRGHDVDLLISDVIMPGGSGVDLAKAVGERYPDTRILLMSGYNDVLEPERAERSYDFLAKPFTPDDLTRAARTALDGQPQLR